MKKKNWYLPSSTGRDTLHAILWLPEGEVRGILQISHGMIEHIGRYDRFAKFMAEKGFAVVGNDHLGHGETAAERNYGYFAPKDGSRYVVRDMHRVGLAVRRKYPGVPYILLGHSMGSFMARRYAMTYGRELDGLILLGTGRKPEVVLLFGRLLVRFLSIFRSERARSRLLEKGCFAFYNHTFQPLRTGMDWLSSDEKQVDAYLKDRHCTFSFTLNGYRTLFEVISYIQKKKNVARLPHNLPMLFLAGKDDPVGDYGSGVKKVASSYRRAGIADVSCRLYSGARHELLNERGYAEVQEDIWSWIQKKCLSE